MQGLDMPPRLASLVSQQQGEEGLSPRCWQRTAGTQTGAGGTGAFYFLRCGRAVKGPGALVEVVETGSEVWLPS